MTDGICARCGGPTPGSPVYDYVRSTELHAALFTLVHAEMQSVRTEEIKFCSSCVRQIERLLYNWWNGLDQDHHPFMRGI